MALWGKNDSAADAPKFRVTDKFVSGRSLTGAANAYANTTVSNGQIVTVAGVDIVEATVQDGKIAHPGWVVVKRGTGPVAGATGSGGTGYVTGNVLTVSNGVANATLTITAAAGAVTGLTLVNPGSGFINTTAIAVGVANSTGGATGVGTGATFVVNLGGRAGRKSVETLVAMGTIAGDGSDDVLFPDS